MILQLFREKILQVQPLNLFDYKDLIPEFQDLEKCQQDSTYHAEGNVLIHTNMVMEKAYEICQKISNHDERVNVYLGALLHDIGKPVATFVKDKNRIVAYNHEQLGVVRARDFLRSHFPEFGFARREWIVSLVVSWSSKKNGEK